MIRLFNPEHDIALATNMHRFTAPHAGRQLRSDLCFIPALWAEDGDIIIVDDIDYAESAYRRLKVQRKPVVEFCTLQQIPAILATEPHHVFQPWGWDLAIAYQLKEAGVKESLLPREDTIGMIRHLSGRQVTTNILKTLRKELEKETCGESFHVTTLEEFDQLKNHYGNIVAKAPWSSSGRGVRYFMQNTVRDNAMNWVSNTIRLQGGIMVEPLYNKVRDFAMEFVRLHDGTVKYLGLSLFHTQNGAYTGNILDTEEYKRMILERYFPLSLLDAIIQRLCRQLSLLLSEIYDKSIPELYLGVDMMVVSNVSTCGFLLHPCVEINLRRTMGHLSLALQETESVMSITYEAKRYHIRVTKS